MSPRVPLYDRLPEIYKIKDEEQSPGDQLKNYLSLIEKAFDAIDENIESLYCDLFIETCDDWVIPYIGDLLGASHINGDPWTLRADVADTVALRKRKGTLGAVERLTRDLTGWVVHCVELRENLVWNQHLNHMKPDMGGTPPYKGSPDGMHAIIRGGTATLRDPATLSLIGTPFDRFAHIADIRPPALCVRHNIPNTAIFLWRLKDYRIPLSKPAWYTGSSPNTGTQGQASHILRSHVHPLGEALKLFNNRRVFDERRGLTDIDETPGPIPVIRINKGASADTWSKYVSFEYYDENHPEAINVDNLSEVSLQFHIPRSDFMDMGIGKAWSVRGADLCAWEATLNPPVGNYEIVVDPVIGRCVIGIENERQKKALEKALLLTYSYGAVGPVGAHPERHPLSIDEETDGYESVQIECMTGNELQDTLTNKLKDQNKPIIIKIKDSGVYDLKDSSLQLKSSLVIIADDYRKPIIRLASSLGFDASQAEGDVTVCLKGLYFTHAPQLSKDKKPLIGKAAVSRMIIDSCTLDPGGYRKLDGSREETNTSIKLEDEEEFPDVPEIRIRHSITGPLFIDTGYTLNLTDSIIDAGSGTEESNPRIALSGPIESELSWGPKTTVSGVTVYGRMRVEQLSGSGGIWVHPLEVLDNQKGCIRFSYFSGSPRDRLPQNYRCVKGTEAKLQFTDEIFGNPGYGQLAHSTDCQIREKGPNDDAMGAFSFMLEAHKWLNLQIRYREFMPVGTRLLIIPVT